MKKMGIADLTDLQGKRVLVRADLNVPLLPKKPQTRNEAAITDDTRIRESLPTIEYLRDRGAKVIVMSHLGQPEGVEEGLRLDVVAKRLSELLGVPVAKMDDCIGPQVDTVVAAMKDGDVLLLENVRFTEAETSKVAEEQAAFARQLANLADIYVNDAFGTAHRRHASTAGVAEYLPAVAGFLMGRELDALSVLDAPSRPFVTILGGAKVSDKLSVVESLVGKVDTLLVGGGMANTFLKAMGYEIGISLYDPEKVEEVGKTLQKAALSTTRLILPVDAVVTSLTTAEVFKASSEHVPIQSEILWLGDVQSHHNILDIGPRSCRLFEAYLVHAELVFWNGPMGLFEVKEFADRTYHIAKALANSSAYTIIGGGDSVAAAEKFELAASIDFISTGGGASLQYLRGLPLPGVEALNDKTEA